MNVLELPSRDKKPRINGLTSLHDVSLTIAGLESILADYHEFVDIAKFGIGTAYITPNLQKKIDLYSSFNIQVYFGGTLFEKFYNQNRMEEYKIFLQSHSVDTLEISEGTVQISLEERIDLVNEFSESFKVFAEVGSKDSESIMSPTNWIHEINSLLDAGCDHVITEGRDSGTAGIFRPSGEIRMGLLDDICHYVDTKKIIFEAPTPKSQMYFINLMGSNVNLGNVNPNDVLILEAQRQGLRSETFYV